jgi:site-specific DNA-cytosine methylase
MELLGTMDFIILGWECEGFSMAGFGKGLNDIRFSLFTNMIRLIA